MRSPVLYLAVWLSGVSLTTICLASESEDIPEYSFDTHPFNVDTFGVMASFIPGKDWDSVIQVNRGFRFAFQQYLESVLHHSLPTSLFHTCSKDNVMHRMLSIPGSWLCSVPRNPDVMQYVPNMPATVLSASRNPGFIPSYCSSTTEWNKVNYHSVSGNDDKPITVTNALTKKKTEYPGTEQPRIVHWLNEDLFVAFNHGPDKMACVGSANHPECGVCWICVGKEPAQHLADQTQINFYELISEGWLPGDFMKKDWTHKQSRLQAFISSI